MTQIEDNQELSILLWDNLLDEVKEGSEKVARVLKETAEAQKQTFLSLVSVYFAKHPEVEAVAWSQTTEEYNDENHGGYEFIEMRPRFYQEKVSPAACDYIREHTEYTDGFLEAELVFRVRTTGTQMPPELLPAIEDAAVMDTALRGKNMTMAESLFGDGGVVATRSGIRSFYAGEDIK